MSERPQIPGGEDLRCSKFPDRSRKSSETVGPDGGVHAAETRAHAIELRGPDLGGRKRSMEV